MLNPIHFKNLIIKPALEHIGLYSKAAEQLLLGTALTESKLTHLRQLGSGPALGLYQIEPKTEQDCWDNYLNFKPDLARKISKFGNPSLPGSEHLIFNLYYATAIARVIYYRRPSALPAENDWAAMAHYWKENYNTHLGAGTPEKFLETVKDALGV